MLYARSRWMAAPRGARNEIKTHTYVALWPPFGGYTITTTMRYNVLIAGADKAEVGNDQVLVMVERMQ